MVSWHVVVVTVKPGAISVKRSMCGKLAMLNNPTALSPGLHMLSTDVNEDSTASINVTGLVPLNTNVLLFAKRLVDKSVLTLGATNTAQLLAHLAKNHVPGTSNFAVSLLKVHF